MGRGSFIYSPPNIAIAHYLYQNPLWSPASNPVATYPFGPQVKFASTKSDTCSSEGRLLGHEKPYTFELNTKMGLGKMHVDCSDMKTLTSWMHAMDEARQHQKAAGAKLAETVNWLNALYQDMEDAYEGVGDKTVDEGAKKKAAALKKKHG